MKQKIYRESPIENVYTPDVNLGKEETIIPTVPMKDYAHFIRPADDKAAIELGAKCADEVKANFIADFERTIAYCERNGEENPDLMVHVSTYIILDGIIYMTYYASTTKDTESSKDQTARFAFCPENDPEDMTIVDLQGVGDELCGRKMTRVYDTILMYKGGDELYLMWTAQPEENYYRFYCTFNMKTKTLGAIKANKFKVGDTVNDFSITGMKAALSNNGIPFKAMWSDIGIMQKLSTREENGETYYYTGAYSGNFNCIIKSRDFITWEYVATPDFINNSRWENATYVIGDRVYYFVRQQECEQGFLTAYDLVKGTWDAPVLIADTQSRSDFIVYKDELYLIHAPVNREGFGIMKINKEDLANSEVVLVADMKESFFYPYVSVYGDDAYISYTIDRKHIRLSKFDLRNYTK